MSARHDNRDARGYENRPGSHSPHHWQQPQPQSQLQPQSQSQQHAYYNLQMYQAPTEVSYHSPSNHGLGSSPTSTNTSGGGGKVVVNGVMFTNPFTGGQPAATTAQSGYQSWHPQQAAYQSNAAVVQPVYAFFGRDPVFVTCPYCHHTDATRTELAIGTASILRCLLLPFLGLLFKASRDTRHYCRNCLNIIATHQP